MASGQGRGVHGSGKVGCHLLCQCLHRVASMPIVEARVVLLLDLEAQGLVQLDGRQVACAHIQGYELPARPRQLHCGPSNQRFGQTAALAAGVQGEVVGVAVVEGHEADELIRAGAAALQHGLTMPGAAGGVVGVRAQPELHVPLFEDPRNQTETARRLRLKLLEPQAALIGHLGQCVLQRQAGGVNGHECEALLEAAEDELLFGTRGQG
mmetsp:Transcript_80291/g.236153  ORF Transcript_80291/g.236153 Transcript_80291/m.236153 type:complete len:210 (+) Transcript_80291:129-758(+)